MSTWGWVFMVGFRVFDLGGLVAWLVWFSRQHDDDDGNDDDGGGGPGAPEPREPPPGLPDADPWPQRLREHGPRRSLRRPRRPHVPQRDRETV